MANIEQVFIFAAGRGDRMRPITDNIPKPLVPIKKKPIIEYILDKLEKIQSLKRVIINGFYLADEIEKFIIAKNNPKIVFSRETKKIETGGALVFAKNQIDLSKPLLIINGDVLWLDPDHQKTDIEFLHEKWNEILASNKSCDILLGLVPSNQYFGYDGQGDFYLGKNNQIFIDKYPKSHAYVGMAIIDPQIIEKAPNQECFSFSYFFKQKIDEISGLVSGKGVELRGKYFHIGTVDAINSTEQQLSNL